MQRIKSRSSRVRSPMTKDKFSGFIVFRFNKFKIGFRGVNEVRIGAVHNEW